MSTSPWSCAVSRARVSAFCVLSASSRRKELLGNKRCRKEDKHAESETTKTVGCAIPDQCQRGSCRVEQERDKARALHRCLLAVALCSNSWWIISSEFLVQGLHCRPKHVHSCCKRVSSRCIHCAFSVDQCVVLVQAKYCQRASLDNRA